MPLKHTMPYSDIDTDAETNADTDTDIMNSVLDYELKSLMDKKCAYSHADWAIYVP
jgi:hypothetical protein